MADPELKINLQQGPQSSPSGQRDDSLASRSERFMDEESPPVVHNRLAQQSHKQDSDQGTNIENRGPQFQGSFPYQNLTSSELHEGISALTEADKVLEMQMKRLVNQAEAVRTELAFTEKTIAKNIEKSFKFMDRTLPRPPSPRKPIPGEPTPGKLSSTIDSDQFGPPATQQQLSEFQASIDEHETILFSIENQRKRLANTTNWIFDQASHLEPDAQPSYDAKWVEEKKQFEALLGRLVKYDYKVPRGQFKTGGHLTSPIAQKKTSDSGEEKSAARRQSLSELSDISEAPSVASMTESVFSIVTRSSMSSVSDLTGAGERFIALLLNDDDLSALYQEAPTRVTATRLERNLRRLLKIFAVDLRKEAETVHQKSAASFVRQWARNSAHAIRNSLFPSETIKGNVPVSDMEPLIQEQADRGSEESEDDDSDPDHDEPSDLQQIEGFIVRSQAFVKFRSGLRQFIHPLDRSKDAEQLQSSDEMNNAGFRDQGSKVSGDQEQTDEQASQSENLAIENEPTTSGEPLDTKIDLHIQQIAVGGSGQDISIMADYTVNEESMNLQGRVDDDKNKLEQNDIVPELNSSVPKHGSPLLRIWSISQFTMGIRKLLQSRVPEGKTRVRWTCSCGQSLYDDYTEMKPGAARRLEISLNQRLGENAAPHNSSWAPLRGFIKMVMNIPGNLRRAKQEQGLPLQQLTPVIGLQQPAVSPPRVPEALFLLICHNVDIYDKKLLQLSICDIESDEKLFRALNNHYRSRFNSFRSLLSFRSLTGIKFVRFELYRKSQSVDVRLKNDIPPSNNIDYRYNPVPIDLMPPVGEERLMHFFKYPECAEDVPACLERFPKKLKGKLSCGEMAIVTGWGLQLEEGVSRSKMTIVYLFLVFISSLWGILWTILGHDIQGAWTVSAYIMGIGVPFITFFQYII